MFSKLALDPKRYGAICAVVAVFCFSVNDTAIKFLSGDYALHQVVLVRASIGMIIMLVLFLPQYGGFAALKTKRLGMHLLRGACVVFANMTFFLGLTALPLAEGVAIFFVSPIIITVFSVIFLKEHVGPFRWAAVVIGFLGVLLVLRPGTSVFQYASLLPIAAAFGYGTLHMLTRFIGKTESALAMSFYIQLTFILISIPIGLAIGDGRFAGTGNASLEFLFRAWSSPSTIDWLILCGVGTASAFGGYFISQAYRISEAAVVAPFEYIALPLAVLWGVLIFNEWPDLIALFGILLIVGSGLFVIWREAKIKRDKMRESPRYRR